MAVCVHTYSNTQSQAELQLSQSHPCTLPLGARTQGLSCAHQGGSAITAQHREIHVYFPETLRCVSHNFIYKA